MKKIILILAICALPVMLLAQEQKSPKEREKEFYEAIEAQINQLTEQLELEDWQIFYVDSILTHDYKAMQRDIEAMSAAKYANSDLFYGVQDKWMEQMYQALRKVFDDKQWAKYLKSGAARDKKLRDKRMKKK
ncbi:MAG: hypothetical protein II809_04490 [Bacteroidales bacterium]|nr:hypothetical protein [Bacteroidales bacterium]